MTAPAPHLPAFAGSLRQASRNRRAIPMRVGGARAAGARVRPPGLRGSPPVHRGDIEVAGMPADVPRLRQLPAGPAGDAA